MKLKLRISHNFKPKPAHVKRGDTLVEVMFAVAIFGLASVGAISIMNRGLYDAQKTLEISMARQEMDAQAEALRFIHEAYITERNNHDDTFKIYTKVWNYLKDLVYKPSDPKLNHFFDSYNGIDCDAIYAGNGALPKRSTIGSSGNSYPGGAPFIVNIRRTDENTIANFMNITALGTYSTPITTNGDAIIVYRDETRDNLLEQSPTYPRLLFTSSYHSSNTTHDAETNLSDRDFDSAGHDISTYYNTLTKAQGIWVVGIASTDDNTPEFYDFYIRTCWDSPGGGMSNTISTVIRLFNPTYHL